MRWGGHIDSVAFVLFRVQCALVQVIGQTGQRRRFFTRDCSKKTNGDGE